MNKDGDRRSEQTLRVVDTKVRELSFGLTGAVQAYIDRHSEELLRRAAVWDTSSDREEALGYVHALRAEWATIPVKEKQIPYVPFEKHFWAIFTALLLCATGKDRLAAGRKLSDDYDERMSRQLKELAVCMRERRALPPHVDARRQTP